MVKIGLQISCQFENVEELKTCHPSYPFFVKVRCNNCGEVSENWHDITGDTRVAEDSRNPKGFNFYIKCKLCSRGNTIDIIDGSNAVYTADDVGNFKTIIAFDCRGAEPIEFTPRSGWIVKGADNGTTFEDVDLAEDDWADYDEKKNVSIGISEFKSQFIKLK